MGLQGNLMAAEIVEQLAYAMRFSGIRNIVFMGMGEPLNNYKAVKVRASVCISELRCCLVNAVPWEECCCCPHGHDMASKGTVRVNWILVVLHRIFYNKR